MLVLAPGVFALTHLALDAVWVPRFDGLPASAWMPVETFTVVAMLAIVAITLWLWQRAGMVNLREGKAAWYGRLVPLRAAAVATSLTHSAVTSFDVAQALSDLGELFKDLLPRAEVGRHENRHKH